MYIMVALIRVSVLLLGHTVMLVLRKSGRINGFNLCDGSVQEMLAEGRRQAMA